jgi:DHA2 family multidrug resistance protein-like MFS transporter
VPWDLSGSLQILAGLTSIVYAIKELAQQRFSAAHFGVALFAGVAFVAIYLRRQSLRAQPLIDLSLFRIRGFSGAFAAATLGTAGVVGIELVMSQYLQLVQQRTALQAALTVLPTAMGGFISGPLAGRMLRRCAAPVLASSGFVVAALCAVALAFHPIVTGTPGMLQLSLLLGIGLGIGATVTCAASVIMNAAPPERGGMAASIEEVGFELGGTLGVALFGSLMTIVYAASLVLPDQVGSVPNTVRDSLDEALQAANSLAPAAANALLVSARTAFSTATAAVLIGVAVLWLMTAAGIRAAHMRNGRRSRHDC